MGEQVRFYTRQPGATHGAVQFIVFTSGGARMLKSEDASVWRVIILYAIWKH